MHCSTMEASAVSAEALIVESVIDIAMLPTVSSDALAAPLAAAGANGSLMQTAGA